MKTKDIDIKLVCMNDMPSKDENNPQGSYRVFVDGIELMILKLTCHSCPEQYDLISLLDNKYLAYFRLRYSNFTVEYYQNGYDNEFGEYIYDEYIGKTGWDGNFENENQRVEHLSKVIKIIVEKLRKGGNNANS